MPLKIKTKIIAVIALSLAIVFLTQAHAEAPIPDKETAIIFDENDFKAYAALKMEEYSWDKEELSCLKRLWGKESAWNHLADNPNSTAFGIAQMLGEKSDDPFIQIRNGLRYIEHRYDKPCNAWRYWQRHNWY
jgi:hypothetical protein